MSASHTNAGTHSKSVLRTVVNMSPTKEDYIKAEALEADAEAKFSAWEKEKSEKHLIDLMDSIRLLKDEREHIESRFHSHRLSNGYLSRNTNRSPFSNSGLNNLGTTTNNLGTTTAYELVSSMSDITDITMKNMPLDEKDLREDIETKLKEFSKKKRNIHFTNLMDSMCNLAVYLKDHEKEVEASKVYIKAYSMNRGHWGNRAHWGEGLGPADKLDYQRITDRIDDGINSLMYYDPRNSVILTKKGIKQKLFSSKGPYYLPGYTTSPAGGNRRNATRNKRARKTRRHI